MKQKSGDWKSSDKRFQRAVVALVIITFGTILLASEAAAGLITSDSSSTTITIHWTAPGDDGNVGTAGQYDIRYSTSSIADANWAQATQVSDEPTPQAAGGAESYVVRNLTPNTTYYFVIKTADDVGNWSTISNNASATTANEQIAPNNIANLATTNLNGTAITLTWTAPGDDSSSGTARQYDIRYSTSTITDANWATATQITGEPTPRIAGTQESFIVTGLQYYTTYYFAIKTADEVPNWSGLSNVTSGRTANETFPPSNIATLAATSPTGTSITLTWLAPGDDSTSGTATTYDIRYSTSAITQANWNSATQANNEPAPRVAGTQESFVVTGLLSGTTYYFAIKTADEVPNWSGLSNVISAATRDITPPAAINDLHVSTGDNFGELDLQWTAPGDDSLRGTALSYVIKASPTLITEANWSSLTAITDAPAPLGPASVQAFTLDSLEPGRTFYVAIKTIDDAGNTSRLSNVDSGMVMFSSGNGIDDEIAGIPIDYNLAPNYPNPLTLQRRLVLRFPNPQRSLL
jgi:hypothetical protein